MTTAIQHQAIAKKDRGAIAAFQRVFGGLLSAVFGALPFFAFVTFLAFMTMSVVTAKLEQHNYQEYLSRTAAVSVEMPKEAPTVSQDSIDAAVEAFSIDVPKTVLGPHLDMTLYDRGLTTGDSFDAEKSVAIGPAAFTSWGILGSTLGHEIEVHAKQSFLKIVLLDKISRLKLSSKRFFSKAFAGNHSVKDGVEKEYVEDGTWKAEREAYQYEMSEAERYGLSNREVKSIEHIVNTYYPAR